jgi:hypothetical protein
LAGSWRGHVAIDRGTLEIKFLADDLVFFRKENVVGDEEVQVTGIHLQLVSSKDLHSTGQENTAQERRGA